LPDGDDRWSVEDLAARLDGHPALQIGEAGRLPAEGMSALDFQQLMAKAAPVRA
jgi:hypothetical protein